MVVIGAGFAGLSAARHLGDQPVEVTIVDHHNFHTFQPLLYQVAMVRSRPGRVTMPRPKGNTHPGCGMGSAA